MVTPPAPIYDTVFYGVFEVFLLEKIVNNLILYIWFVDNFLDLWKIYEKEGNAAELWVFQETMQEWYGLEWTFQGPFLKLDFTDLTIANKKKGSQPTCLEKNPIYTYTYQHIWIAYQESSTESSIDRSTASPLWVMKNRTRKS